LRRRAVLVEDRDPRHLLAVAGGRAAGDRDRDRDRRERAPRRAILHGFAASGRTRSTAPPQSTIAGKTRGSSAGSARAATPVTLSRSRACGAPVPAVSAAAAS